MDIIRLYNDFGIPYQTEGHKHCRPGWVNTECPFCIGNPGLHLGFEYQKEIFVCWRCGWKPKGKAIAKLLGVTEPRAWEIIKEYGGKTTPVKNLAVVQNKKPFRFPTETMKLMKNHKKYLRKRDFKPKELERTWGIMGTGPGAKLDGIDYKNRILIPIRWGNETVSFQTRDISGKHPAKYMACPEFREKIKHKHIIYAHPYALEKRQCLCVEGVTDVWRLGTDAVAVFGIKYTTKQIQVLKNHFDKITVVFDSDIQAIEQAKKLVGELQFFGVDSDFVVIKGDPADLSQDEVTKLIRKYISW